MMKFSAGTGPSRGLWVGVALAAACSSTSTTNFTGIGAMDASNGAMDGGGTDGGTDSGTEPGFEGGLIGTDAATVGTGPVEPTGPVTDFPMPVLDGNAPSNSPTLFGPISQGAATGGPCLTEPESDVVFPQNWLRPRFKWTAVNGETLFELRLHVANQIKDLVVYTTNTTWTMPQATWDALRTHSPTEAMTLTVRGAVLSGSALQGEALGTSTPMGIAPVQATGAIVYWTTSGTTALMGFSPGDDTVEKVLTPTQYVAQQPSSGSICIGCHSSTPGGEYVAFTTTTSAYTAWSNGMALINPKDGPLGSVPSFVTPAGAQALARWNQSAVAFSPAHWMTGDHRGIASYDNSGSATDIVLSWFDVGATSAATATGIIARNGDTQLAGAPAWSHDGNTIVYVSTNRVCNGRLGNCNPNGAYEQPQDPGSRASLWTVPYEKGAGGTAVGLQGASDGTVQSYSPALSPDDKFIAYNRAPNDAQMYNQPAAEVYVIASKGGTPTRLAANDPPVCSGATSPGITNSWAKWSPTALQANGNTYYWLIFSSQRYSSGTPQLYITSIIQAADGTLKTHGALYLWNQPATEENHTPAWDTFQVPPIVTQ
jgi:hypothetical protein